jgi:acetylornithine deacetylase/succinyl-diaminopimelate desuccinylase-like protein
MREQAAKGPPYPPVNLILVGNEENGEGDPYGTPHVLDALERGSGWTPDFMVVGERTGEQGEEIFGEICTESRGIIRALVTATGVSGHTGTSGSPADLLDKLVEARAVLKSNFKRHLTLASADGWESSARFPFMTVGEPGVYNITASHGVLGIEIRPIPGDDLEGFVAETNKLCRTLDLEFTVEVSVYVDPDHQGAGVARALYEHLIPTLAAQGFRSVVAAITVPNPACERLHRAFGFREVGLLSRVGWKFDRWHDVSNWQRALRVDDRAPGAIKTVSRALMLATE